MLFWDQLAPSEFQYQLCFPSAISFKNFLIKECNSVSELVQINLSCHNTPRKGSVFRNMF